MERILAGLERVDKSPGKKKNLDLDSEGEEKKPERSPSLVQLLEECDPDEYPFGNYFDRKNLKRTETGAVSPNQTKKVHYWQRVKRKKTKVAKKSDHKLNIYSSPAYNINENDGDTSANQRFINSS